MLTSTRSLTALPLTNCTKCPLLFAPQFYQKETEQPFYISALPKRNRIPDKNPLYFSVLPKRNWSTQTKKTSSITILPKNKSDSRPIKSSLLLSLLETKLENPDKNSSYFSIIPQRNWTRQPKKKSSFFSALPKRSWTIIQAKSPVTSQYYQRTTWFSHSAQNAFLPSWATTI